MLHVIPAGTAGNASATVEDVCEGNYTNLILTDYSGTIQWQQSIDGITGWIDVTDGSGETTDTYTTSVLTETIYYRAEVTSVFCSPVHSNVVQVMVYPLPATGAIIPD